MSTMYDIGTDGMDGERSRDDKHVKGQTGSTLRHLSISTSMVYPWRPAR